MSKITTTKIKNSDSPSTPKTTDESFDQKIDKVSIFIEKNAKVFVFGFLGLLIGCAGYFTYSLYSKNLALKKFDMAYKIELEIKKLTDSKNKADLDAETQSTDIEANKTKSVEDINKQVADFLSSNPAHGASRNLALNWSSYLYSIDKFEMANETLALLNLKKSNSLNGLAALSKASSTLQSGNIEGAISIYKSILSTSNWGFLHPEARFQLSLALVEANKIQDAIENLKTIQVEHPDERKTVEESKKIIRWLTFQKNKD